MSISKTLVGGLIGAVVGVLAHVALEVFAGLEADWFGVLIGVLVGVSVRRLDPTVIDRASYLRGAIAALLTLVAIIGSSWVIPRVLVAMGAQVQTSPPPTIEREDVEAEPAEGGGEAVEMSADDRFSAPRGDPAGPPVIQRGEFSVVQFTSIAIGMFLAYEMARGTTRIEEQEAEGGDGAPPEGAPHEPAAPPAE